MDLNYLLYRQQTEQMRSNGAACEPSRRAHAELARAYGRLIGVLPGAAKRLDPA